MNVVIKFMNLCVTDVYMCWEPKMRQSHKNEVPFGPEILCPKSAWSWLVASPVLDPLGHDQQTEHS